MLRPFGILCTLENMRSQQLRSRWLLGVLASEIIWGAGAFLPLLRSTTRSIGFNEKSTPLWASMPGPNPDDTTPLKVGLFSSLSEVNGMASDHSVRGYRWCFAWQDCLQREYTNFFAPMELEFYDPEVSLL